MNRLKTRNIYFVIVAALTLICLFVWRLVTDIYADDLFYMHKFTQAEILYDQGPLITTFTDAIEDAVYHYTDYNCRLANMICIFSSLIPRWVVNVLDGIVGCVFFLMLFKAARIVLKRVNMTTAVVGTLLFWLAFPWYNTMCSSDFFMNYAWSSAFVLVIVHFLRKSHELSKLQLGAVSFFAVFAAWMHEAFGCALIAYTFFVWLLGAKIDKSSRFIIGLGLCVGLFITMAGSTTSRIDSALTGPFLGYLRYRITTYISQLWPIYVAILTTVLLRKKVGKQQFAVYRVDTIASFVAMAVACGISLAVNSQDRALWPAHLFAVLQTIRCVNALTYKQKDYSKVAKIVFGCATVLYAMWSCELIKWQKKFTDENNGLIAATEKADKPLVYYDLTSASDVPFYLMGIVKHEWYSFYNCFLAIFTEHGYNVLILPTKYEGVPLDEINVPGSQRIKGVYPIFYTINDTTISRFNALLGEPQRAVVPIDRLMMKFTAEQVAEPFDKVKLPSFDVDGKEITLYSPIEVGRTVKYRKFVRIEE
jgi:hypothetical protein